MISMMMSEKEIKERMKLILMGYLRAVDDKSDQAIFQAIGNLHALYWVLEGESPPPFHDLLMYIQSEGT